MSSSRRARFQKFLVDKKPILDILVTILLGMMAIVLTLVANRISESQLQVAERQAVVAESQLQLAERQTMVAEVQLQPRFRFRLERITDELHGTHEVLQLYNDGAPIEAFTFGHAEFVEVSTEGSFWDRDRRVIPVYYFIDDQPTGNQDSLLLTLRSSISSLASALPPMTTTQKSQELKESLRKLGRAFPPMNTTQKSQELEEDLRKLNNIDWVRIHKFFRIEYVDAIGIERSAHYEVSPGSDHPHYPAMPRRLSSEAGLQVVNLFQGGFYHDRSVLELTAGAILDQWQHFPKAELLENILLGDDGHHNTSPEEMADRFGGFRDP